MLCEPFVQQGLLWDIDGLAAMGAEPAGESLGDDQRHGRGDIVRRHAHVDEPRQGLRGIVGVQGGEHQVAGLGGLDGDLGGLEVPDLADHDDIGVLAQERPQRAGEREPHLRIDVHLVDAGEVDLGRVFGGGDIAIFRVENVQCCVERYRFTASRRPRHQDHALRSVNGFEEQVFLKVLVSEGVDSDLRSARIQNTQHHLLAEQGRAGADTKIDRAVLGQGHFHAPVLGNPALGDVEPRHDLQARGEAGTQVGRRGCHLVQDAVLAKPYAVGPLIRLEVDIGSALVDRVQEHLVHEAHDRGVIDVQVGRISLVFVLP